MIRHPPSSTCTDTLCPSTALFLAIWPVITGALPLASAVVTLSLVSLVANIWRLRGDARVAHGGTPQLYLHRLRTWTVTRVVLGAAGLAAVLLGAAWVAVVVLLAAEVVGRWLFYVTVVPANMPGSFWRHTAGSHR